MKIQKSVITALLTTGFMTVAAQGFGDTPYTINPNQSLQASVQSYGPGSSGASLQCELKVQSKECHLTLSANASKRVWGDGFTPNFKIPPELRVDTDVHNGYATTYTVSGSRIQNTGQGFEIYEHIVNLSHSNCQVQVVCKSSGINFSVRKANQIQPGAVNLP